MFLNMLGTVDLGGGKTPIYQEEDWINKPVKAFITTVALNLVVLICYKYFSEYFYAFLVVKHIRKFFHQVSLVSVSNIIYNLIKRNFLTLFLAVSQASL